MHRATAKHDLASHKGMAAVSSGVVVLVDNVDDHFRRARAAGAVIEASQCFPSSFLRLCESRFK